MPHSTFDGFIRGKGGIYQNFWSSRQQDLQALSQSQVQALIDYFNEQVFGVTMDEFDEEYERQKAFNEAKWRELAAKREDDGDGSGTQEIDGAENEKKGSSNQVEDDEQDSK